MVRAQVRQGISLGYPSRRIHQQGVPGSASFSVLEFAFTTYYTAPVYTAAAEAHPATSSIAA